MDMVLSECFLAKISVFSYLIDALGAFLFVMTSLLINFDTFS